MRFTPAWVMLVCRGEWRPWKRREQLSPHCAKHYLALVQAHEKAGRPERALALHRELTLHIRKAQHDSIVGIRNCICSKLRLADQFPEHLLQTRKLNSATRLPLKRLGQNKATCSSKSLLLPRCETIPTGEHCYRVAKLSSLLAKALGQSDDACETIDLAARLHDIGKVGIPDSLMQKPQPFPKESDKFCKRTQQRVRICLSKTKVSYSELA